MKDAENRDTEHLSNLPSDLEDQEEPGLNPNNNLIKRSYRNIFKYTRSTE